MNKEQSTLLCQVVDDLIRSGRVVLTEPATFLALKALLARLEQQAGIPRLVDQKGDRRAVIAPWETALTTELRTAPIDFERIIELTIAGLAQDEQMTDRLSLEELSVLLEWLPWKREDLSRIHQAVEQQKRLDSQKYTDRGEGLISNTPLFRVLEQKLKSLVGEDK